VNRSDDPTSQAGAVKSVQLRQHAKVNGLLRSSILSLSLSPSRYQVQTL
jgi:hypothetical protein